MPPVLFAVRLEHGGPWDWSTGLREQDGWDEHARFMDSLVDDGFILLGGPLEGDRDVLHVVEAPSGQAVREGWRRTTGTGTGCCAAPAPRHGRSCWTGWARSDEGHPNE